MTDNHPDTIRHETLLVAWTALALALVSLAYCVRHGTLLLFGDAVAHLHIARRVFDSLTPGYRQLGSVWLPLPHILLLPFVANTEWWHNGLAGACLSIPGYVLGCAGLYRLARIWLDRNAAIVAAAFYGLNPGLLYLATTAMTEPLFLAEMIWSLLLIVLYQQELKTRQEPRPGLLIGAGLVLVCAVYTRYDGWIYAAVLWCFATWPLMTTYRLWANRRWMGPVAGAWVFFTAMLLAAPALWLAYNAKQFGDPLDFIRGPYSARAIEAATTPPGSSPRPGLHNMRVSVFYFLKAAELGAAPAALGKLLCWLTAVGTLAACWVFRRRQIWPVLLLWLPLPFYAYSVAYGSVPIFIPVWQPYSWYNTRYGMELLPAFALFLACLVGMFSNWRPNLRTWLPAIAVLLILANAIALLRARPLVFQEALANSRTRITFETALGKLLLGLPGQGTILMHVSSDVGAVQQAALPLRRIINEGDYLLWQHALEHPAQSASIVVALDGDPVAMAVERHPEGLEITNVLCSTGQPCARLYRRKLSSPSR
jgi:hypothetical protein